MKQTKIYLLLLLTLLSVGSFAQFSAPQWEKAFGGSMFEYAKEVSPTSDGGFITIGYSESTNGDVSANHGNGDCWVVKFNSSGAIQWEHAYGGTGYDYGYSIVQTTDGGYIAVGSSESANGDLTYNFGGSDCWVIKLDALGNVLWQKVYGGSLNDNGQSIRQTPDGGYVVAGNTESNDGDVTVSFGSSDCWILKLNSAGFIQWQKTMGGSAYDFAQCVDVSAAGEFIFCGGTHSADYDVAEQKGNGDCWAVKLSATGALIWEYSFGGTQYDFAQFIESTSDGSYILAGYTDSNDGDVVGSNGTGDCWALKFDNAGSVIWQNALGSNGNDYAYCIHETSSGKFILSGYSELSNGDVTGNHGDFDSWVVMLRTDGEVDYQRSLGGGALDIGYSVCELTSGSFVVAGYSQSDDGDVATNHGGGDSWVVKVNATYTGVEEMGSALISVSPNPGVGTFYFSGLTGAYTLEIFDATGKLVRLIESRQATQKVDLEHQVKGIYMYRVVGESGKRASGKFILN